VTTLGVDLFAGWGGFTEGAEQAGVRVVWAANHWPIAVHVHRRNHPGTLTICQDLRQADWTSLPAYDLLLAAPACQPHSMASQPRRRPYHDAMRQTAWSVIDCAEVTRPKKLVVENVPAFLEWELFDLWLAALRRLTYHVTVNILRASYLGTPQRRDRVFIVGSLKKAISIQAGPTIEPAFGPCIEWNAPGWRPIDQAAIASRVSMRSAQARFGPRALVQYVTDHSGIPITEPLRTITTKDQWVVVDGENYRPFSLREYARAMGFRDDYYYPENAARNVVIKGFGNAVCPKVGEFVVRRVAEA
jgi:DNA (cytosine-5)-methyltransferase 1